MLKLFGLRTIYHLKIGQKNIYKRLCVVAVARIPFRTTELDPSVIFIE